MVETIADLLEGSLQNITWKPEFRNKPVLIAGGPRGLSVREDLLCASIALTEYFARRALNAGYGPSRLHNIFHDTGITFYWLRKGIARVWVRLFGDDAGREIMGHAPDSRTLEQYYVELRSSKSVGAAALDENVEARQAKDITEESALALNQVMAENLAKTQGHVLNAQYRQMVAADQSKPVFTTGRDVKGCVRRMRRIALLAVIKAVQN